MAKKETLKLDDFDFDDDFDSLFSEFSSEDVKDDRKPVTKIKDQIKKSAKQRLVNPNYYEKIVKKTLPREYGEIYDQTTEVANSVKYAFTDAVDLTKPAAANLTRALNKLVPESFQKTKAQLEKIEQWGRGYESSYAKRDEAAQREDSISMELGKIFQAQMTDQVKARAEDRNREKINDLVGVRRHQDQMTLLNQISVDMRRMAQYESVVTQAWQKKTLELQYRSYYVQADMLNLQKSTTEAMMARLDAISKNTALPEYVKLRNTEYFKSHMRSEFTRQMTGGIFGDSREGMKKFVENFGNKMKSNARDFAYTVGSIADIASSASEDDGFGPPKSGGEKAAEFITDLFMDWGGGKLGKKGYDKLLKEYPELSKKIGLGTENIRFLLANQQEVLKKALSAKNIDTTDIYKDDAVSTNWEDIDPKKLAKVSGGSILELLKDSLRSSLPGIGTGVYLEKDDYRKLREPTPFTGQTQKSIVEVIPGLLSRILRELRVTRTGDESTSLVEYDYTKNSFSTQDKLAEDIRNLVAPERRKQRTAAHTNRFLKDIGIGEQFDNSQKRLFAAAVLKGNYNQQLFDEDFFKDARNFTLNEGDEDKAKKISEAFQNLFNQDIDDVERAKRRNLIAENAKDYQSSIRNTRGSFQHLINQGQIDILRKSGFMDESDNFNIEHVMNVISGYQPDKETKITSDFNVKDSIARLDPRKALDKLSKISISKWKYKKGTHADDGGEEHVGPMAQDMHSAFGEDVAPGRKKIDIGNTMGTLIGAVKGLNEKISEKANLGEATPEQTLLAAILEMKDNLADIHSAIIGGIVRGIEPGTVGDNVNRLFEQGAKWRLEYVQGTRIRFRDLFSRRPKNADGTPGKRFEGLEDRLNLFANYGQQTFKDVLSSIGVIKKDIDESVEKTKGWSSKIWDEIHDIYVEGEDTPRMSKKLINKGRYVDFKTGEVITKIEDIRNEVYDIKDGSIVIMVEDIPNLVVRNRITGEIMRIGKSIFGKAKSELLKTWEHRLPAGWGLAWRVGSSIVNKIGTLLDAPQDVYVAGEEEPRLKKIGFTRGWYFDQVTGKVITRPGEVQNPVIDKDQNVLISEEDFEKGLVDSKGRPIRTIKSKLIGLGIGLGAFAARKLKRAWRKTKVLSKRAFGFASTQAGRAARALEEAGLTAKEYAGDAMRGIKNWRDEDSMFTIGIGGKQHLDVLQQIRDILDSRLPGGKPKILGDHDNDGDRDGSWQDQFQNKTEETEETYEKSETTSYKSGNIFDKVGSKVSDMIGKLIDGALGLLGLGGLFGGGKGAADGVAKTGKVAGLVSKIKSLASGKVLAALVGTGLVASVMSYIFGASKEEKSMASMQTQQAIGYDPEADDGGMGMAGWGLAGMAGAGTIMGLRRKIAGAAGPVEAGSRGRAVKKRGWFNRMMRHGARTGFKTTGTLAKGTIATGVGIGKAGRGLTKGGHAVGKYGLMPLLKAGGYLGKGVLKAIPFLGTGLALASAAGDIQSGDYGSAALNLGLAGVSTFGLGATMSAVGATLGAAAGLIFNPVTIGALAAGLAGYAFYKGYKWITRKKFNDLDRIRMFQYGITSNDTELMLKIYNLEKYLQSAVTIKTGEAKIDENKVKIEDIFKILEVNTEDRENVSRFGIWFNERFKPVFMANLVQIEKMTKSKDIDATNEIKKSKDKVEYIDRVSVPVSAYMVQVLPFAKSPQSVVGPGVVENVTREYRMKFLSEIKPGEDKVEEGVTGKVKKALGFKSPTNQEKFGTRDADKDSSELSKKISQSINKEIATRGGLSAITIGSDKTEDWYSGRKITAFDAVRYRAYGLEKLDQGPVASLRWLENACTKELNLEPNGSVFWRGTPETILNEARRFFGFDINNSAQDASWIKWFMKRFLPIYTSMYVTIMKSTSSQDFVQGKKLFKQETNEAVAYLEQLVAMRSIWHTGESPWPGMILLSDPMITRDNIAYLKKLVKDRTYLEEKLAEQQTKDQQSKKREQEHTQKQLDTLRQQEAQRQQQMRANADKEMKELLKREGYNEDGTVPSEPEEDQKASPHTTKSPAQGAGVSGGGGSPTTLPPVAPGDLKDGTAAMAFVTSGHKLKGVHPAFLKVLLGAIQEYGERTGKKVNINDGFRTAKMQADRKAKYGGGAASVGHSVHEFGLGVDIPSVTLNEMEKMGILRKYGLTRPIGQEAWHVEPAGIQTNLNKYKRDHQATFEAVKAGIGRGGGGYGTIGNKARKWGRDHDMARRLLTQVGGPDATKLQNELDNDPALVASKAIGKAQQSSQGQAALGGGVQRTASGGVVGGGAASASGMPAGRGDVGAGQGSYKGSVDASGGAMSGMVSAEPESPPSGGTGGRAIGRAGGSSGLQGMKGIDALAKGSRNQRVNDLLDLIARGEGTTEAKAKSNDFPSSYDIPLGFGKYGRPPKPLTQMTLNEISEFGYGVRKRSGKLNSSAMGRYQIVGDTMRELMKTYKIPGNALFTPQLQDRMAMYLLNRRNIDDFLKGKISQDKFQMNLAYEWASVAKPTTGKAIQHTGTKDHEIKAALEALKGSGGATMASSSIQQGKPGSATSTEKAKTATDTRIDAAPMRRQADGTNVIESASEKKARLGGSQSPSSGFVAGGATYGTLAGNNRSQSVYDAMGGMSNIPIEPVSQRPKPTDILLTNQSAPEVREQPQHARANEAIEASVKNVGEILLSQLDVQKEILVVMKQIASRPVADNKIPQTRQVSPETTKSPDTKTPNPVDLRRIPRETKLAPMSMRNKVFT